LYGKVWYCPAMSRSSATLSRDDPVPIYEQLAAIIAAKIAAGRFASGERLPTELDLAQDYAISRETVRQALGVLERRGLVVRRRAKGTFVAVPRVSQDLAELRSFHGGLLKQGVAPEMELLEWRPAKTPASFAAAFKHRDVMRLLRRYAVDGKPLAIADVYLHEMARTISWDIAQRNDTYSIFERFLKTPVARASVTIRADIAGRSMGKLLALRPSAPVMLLVQTHFAASGEVLVCSSLTVRADAYEFHIDLPSGIALRDRLSARAIKGAA
jgi:GntR family transcriptional regulator